MKSSKQKRFAVGAKVRISSPGINGIVIQADDEPTVMAEYWHTVEYQFKGETYSRRENGGNLELVPLPITNEPKQAWGSTTINQYGVGSRTYVGSHDHSINFVGASMDDVFKQVREQIAVLVPDATYRDNILGRLDELEAAQNTPSWTERYTQLMAVVSDHITVLGWMLPPLLQRLLENHHIS